MPVANRQTCLPADVVGLGHPVCGCRRDPGRRSLADGLHPSKRIARSSSHHAPGCHPRGRGDVVVTDLDGVVREPDQGRARVVPRRRRQAPRPSRDERDDPCCPIVDVDQEDALRLDHLALHNLVTRPTSSTKWTAADFQSLVAQIVVSGMPMEMSAPCSRNDVPNVPFSAGTDPSGT